MTIRRILLFDNNNSNNNNKQTMAIAQYYCLTDQIDENLKIALQKDLNAMAPGLSVQVQLFWGTILL